MFKVPPCLFLDSLFLLQNNIPLYRCTSLYGPPGRYHSELQTPYDDRQVLLCHTWKEVPMILNHIVCIYVIYSSVIQKVIFKKASGFHSSGLYLLILKGIGNLEILTLKSYRMYCYFTFLKLLITLSFS